MKIKTLIHFPNSVFWKIFICLFTIGFNASCASIEKNVDEAALTYIAPLINEEPCGERKGIYRKIKNSHSSKIIIATVETDVSPDPENWYPTQRDFTLKPGHTRILGCSVIINEAGQLIGNTTHVILSAKFK